MDFHSIDMCIGIVEIWFRIVYWQISSFLCPSTKKVAGYYVILSEILSVRPSVSAPTILLPATPPTVLGQSFSNFTGPFRMVWKYAYCFFRILKIFFVTFFCIFNLDFFRALILQKCIGSMYLLPATPPNPFQTLHALLGWSEDMHIVFSESWNYFLSHFLHFNSDVFRALILQKCIGSCATPPTFSGRSFWNFSHAFRMVWRYAYCFFFQNPDFIFYHFLFHFLTSTFWCFYLFIYFFFFWVMK